MGRILADELRRFAIEERGYDIGDVADADSGGLDESGRFREEDFEGGAAPVVYVYRFILHRDFGRWKLPAMHAFCETFGSSAAILAQWHTTAFFTESDFERLGFQADYPDDAPDATVEHQQWLKEQGPWKLV